MHAPVLWQNAVVLQRLTERKEWKFFIVLPEGGPRLGHRLVGILLVRGILPAAVAIAMGALVAAVQHGNPLGSACLRWRDLRVASDTQPDSSVGERQSGRPHCRLAL